MSKKLDGKFKAYHHPGCQNPMATMHCTTSHSKDCSFVLLRICIILNVLKTLYYTPSFSEDMTTVFK